MPHKDVIKRREYAKQYRLENLEKIKNWQKAYKEKNREKVKELSHTYYLENREYIKARTKKYSEEHKEEKSRRAKELYIQNKEKIKVQVKKRLERKVLEDPDYHKKRYWQRRDEQLAHNKARTRAQKELVISHYSKGLMACNCCGESILEFLTVDHIDNNGAEHRAKIGKTNAFYVHLIKNNFPEDYNLQVLCFNCNITKAQYGSCPHGW